MQQKKKVFYELLRDKHRNRCLLIAILKCWRYTRILCGRRWVLWLRFIIHAAKTSSRAKKKSYANNIKKNHMNDNKEDETFFESDKSASFTSSIELSSRLALFQWRSSCPLRLSAGGRKTLFLLLVSIGGKTTGTEEGTTKAGKTSWSISLCKSGLSTTITSSYSALLGLNLIE